MCRRDPLLFFHSPNRRSTYIENQTITSTGQKQHLHDVSWLHRDEGMPSVLYCVLWEQLSLSTPEWWTTDYHCFIVRCEVYKGESPCLVHQRWEYLDYESAFGSLLCLLELAYHFLQKFFLAYWLEFGGVKRWIWKELTHLWHWVFLPTSLVSLSWYLIFLNDFYVTF